MRAGRLRVAALFAPLASLGGCMVGPNYAGPPDVAPAARTAPVYRRAAVAPVTAAPPLARWWTALGDETLNRVMDDALANSPTLERALGVVREARARVRESGAALLPQGGANAIYAHVDTPSAINDVVGDTGGGSSGTGSRVPDHLNIYNVGVLATWEIDLFGGTRRQVASSRATLQASEAALDDARVTLTREVATAYVNLRDAQRRFAFARQNTQVEQRVLELTRRRRLGGTVTDLEVERALTQLKQTQATVVPLAGQVEIYTDQLSQLAGHEPGMLEPLLATARPLPLPPQQTAIGNPGDLLRRRPDVRAAERRLAAANEQIGANLAQYYPTINLTGTVGYGATSVSNLFDGGNLLKLVAPVLSWNFLGFPRIDAQVGEARGRFDQARAAYRATVLQALLDAENGLSRFGHDRDNVASLADASASASRTAAKTDLRYRGGTVTLIDALDTERQRLSAESSLAQAQAMMTSDWISLQSSLGLGWNPAPIPRSAEPR